MSMYTNWIHGNNVKIATSFPPIQDPPWAVFHSDTQAQVILAAGAGLTTPGTFKTTLFIAIPTPVVVNSTRVTISEVSVRLSSTVTPLSITGLRVYDGETVVMSLGGLSIGSTTMETYSWDIQNSPPVVYGVSLSLDVTYDFNPNAPGEWGWIYFVGAGATFSVVN
jgi:hypothetical protein